MLDWTRASIIAGAACGAVACGIAAWHVATRDTACTVVVPPAPIVKVVAPAPPPPAPRAPPESRVVVGEVDLDWMPPGYVQKIGAARTAELAKVVEAWAADDAFVHLEHRRGIAYAQSAADVPLDGPRSQATLAGAQRVCGSAAQWLRTSVRQALANKLRGQAVTCHENVCAFAPGELEASGYVVFRPLDRAWILDAYVEVYAVGLAHVVAEKNVADVVAGLRRVARIACPGEPPGTD